METFLRDLNLNWCLIYLDDVVIFSKDPTSQLLGVEAMFKKLEHAGLKLEPLMCELFHKQITYLAHMVSVKGIGTNEKKTELIEKWSTPTTH